jgi:hypothetical protein
MKPILTIRPNKLYKEGMSQEELYDISRGIWKITPSRISRIKFAVVFYKGIAKEVFEILSWHPANTTPYKYFRRDHYDTENRWEFVGRPAGKNIRDQFVGKYMEFKQGDANPASIRDAEKLLDV